MKLLKMLAVALSMVLPAPLFAATAVYEVTGGDVVVDSLFGSVDYLGSDGNLSITVSGFLIGGTLDASLSVLDGGQTLLSSNDSLGFTLDVASGPLDKASITFGSLAGDDAALFGPSATVEFLFDLGTADATSLPGFVFIEDVTAQVLSNVAPVPLPASLPLLGAALAGTVALRRKKRRAA